MPTKVELEKQVQRLEKRLRRSQTSPEASGAVPVPDASPPAEGTPSQPTTSWRGPALAGSAGALIGFGAAALLTGNALVGVAALVYLAWSVLFGLFVLAPWAGNAARNRFVAWLTEDSEEAAESKRLIILTMLGEATLLLRREKGLPKEQRLGAAFARELWDVLGEDAESTVQGHLGAVASQVQRYAGNVGVGEMIAEAKRSGVEINPKLEQGLRTVELLTRFADRLGGRGGGGQPRPGLLGRRKPPEEGIGGYG